MKPRPRSRFSALLLVASACLALCAAVQAQTLKVTLLGTGNPRPVIERFGASTLVEAGGQKLLFDCGRGAIQRLYQLQVPFSEVNVLFLTHLHSDHTVGIPDFWLTGWLMGRKVPLRVFGPAGTKEMMANLEKAYAFDVHIRRDEDTRIPGAGAELVVRDIAQGVVFESNGVKVTAFTVDHGAIKPALGYRVDFAGHSVVLSGDTRFSENLIQFAQGTDVLIHEVVDPVAYNSIRTPLSKEQMQQVIAHHTTPEQAGIVFTRVKPKLGVYSHIVPGVVPDLVAHTRTTYTGPLEVGEDLMSIEIGDKIEVHRPH
jgi:ribonuclease Z